MEDNIKPIKLLVSIVNRGKGKKIEELFLEIGITYQLICLGHGTANSELLDYLGLGETDKDIVLSVVPKDQVQTALDIIKQKMHFEKPGNGIAFTIQINSVGGPKTLQFLSGLLRKEQ